MQVIGIFSVLFFLRIGHGFPQIAAPKSVEVGGRQFPLRLQPELDRIDITRYLKNERLILLQIKCLLDDSEPCDIVGRWAKPRVKAGLLGECLACTEVQKGWLDTWLQILIEKFPEFYRAAVAKYIHNSGIQLAPEEYARINTTFSEESLKKAAQVFHTLDVDDIARVEAKPAAEKLKERASTTSKDNTNRLISNDVQGGSKSRVRRSGERGPSPVSSPVSHFTSSSSISSSGSSAQRPRLGIPAPGMVLTYDGQTVDTSDGSISVLPNADRRTPSVLHRPQFGPYRGDFCGRD